MGRRGFALSKNSLGVRSRTHPVGSESENASTEDGGRLSESGGSARLCMAWAVSPEHRDIDPLAVRARPRFRCMLRQRSPRDELQEVRVGEECRKTTPRPRRLPRSCENTRYHLAGTAGEFRPLSDCLGVPERPPVVSSLQHHPTRIKLQAMWRGEKCSEKIVRVGFRRLRPTSMNWRSEEALGGWVRGL